MRSSAADEDVLARTRSAGAGVSLARRSRAGERPRVLQDGGRSLLGPRWISTHLLYSWSLCLGTWCDTPMEKKMISPPSKEQFNSRPEDSWPLFSLEFFWHGSLTELRVSDFSPETHRFIQLSAAAVTTKPLPSICLQTGKQVTNLPSCF